MTHDYTLHTYVGTLKACNNARRYLAGRNILSEAHKIKHGHYKFTAHFPAKIEEIHARRVMYDAFHGVFIEPFVKEADAMTITDNPISQVANVLRHSTSRAPKPAMHSYRDSEGVTHYVGPAIAVNAGLCGNDDAGEDTTDPVDCKACLAIVRYVLSGGRQE